MEAQHKLSMSRATIWWVVLLASVLINALVVAAIGSAWSSLAIGSLWRHVHIDGALFETGLIVLGAPMMMVLVWTHWRRRGPHESFSLRTRRFPAKKARLAAGVNGESRINANKEE